METGEDSVLKFLWREPQPWREPHPSTPCKQGLSLVLPGVLTQVPWLWEEGRLDYGPTQGLEHPEGEEGQVRTALLCGIGHTPGLKARVGLRELPTDMMPTSWRKWGGPIGSPSQGHQHVVGV